MVCSTFNPLTLQKYQLDPEDLCSLCGVNHGKAAMIECKDKIHICLNCVDVLGNDSNLLIVFYVQIMPDDFVMQLHRF
ncbi:putative phosphatidate cytidylyltransferase [Escherichia coli]|nr:putative phosphatidate cytidylyltransferase [Escherichia coli]